MIVAASVLLNSGHFVYALDDPYIHLAIARSLARHAVWGIGADGFTNSSSSPLWVLLLALFTKLGWSAVPLPFCLNIVAGTGAIVTASRWLTSERQPNRGLLALAAAAAPLPAMALVGMEHSLQIWLTTAALYVGSRALAVSREGASADRMPKTLMLLAPLLSSTRYEGLFLLAPMCLMFALRGRVKYAFGVGLAAVAPLVAIGIWSVQHGWFAVPNSVLLKGTMPPATLWGLVMVLALWFPAKLLAAPHLFLLATASAAVVASGRRRLREWNASDYAAATFVSALVLQVQFAQTGSLFRYDAHLVFAGLLLVLPSLQSWFAPMRDRGAVATPTILLVILALPFASRTVGSLPATPVATANIFQQQVQSARFVRTYYAGRTVAVNDIGAVAFMGDARVLDLWGLASMEAARLRLSGHLGSAELAELVASHHAPIAVVYDLWFEGRIPPGWTPVASWRIRWNVVCGQDTVTIYATTRDEVEPLRRHVAEFEPSLPAAVERLPVHR